MANADVISPIEAELTLLASVLAGGDDYVDDIAAKLSAGDFSARQHGELWRQIVGARTAKEPISLWSIYQRCKANGSAANIGDARWWHKLADYAFSPHQSYFYGEQVRQASLSRRLVGVCEAFSKKTMDGTVSGEQAVREASAAINAILEDCESERSQVTLPVAVDERVAEIEREADGQSVASIPLGFPTIDRLVWVSGKPGCLNIIGGRPGMGKSQFAQVIGLNAARAGHPVQFFSLEMSPAELADRAIANMAGIDSHLLAHPADLHADDWQQIERCRKRFDAMPFVIEDTPGIGMAELESRVRVGVRKFGTQIVIVDYLQIMDMGSERRLDAITDITSRMKRLARREGVVLFLLSQLRRLGSGEAVRSPRMDDLRESGSIEQDANSVMLIHRPFVYMSDLERAHDHEQAEPKRYAADIDLAKQRGGPTGLFTLHCDVETCRWTEQERHHDR